MAHDVFISHSVKDKPIADAVCATLESEGIRCWIAPRDVVPGMEWSECIIEAIEQTKVMVLVFTADANASPQIRREVERAVNRGVAILPLRIEDVLPARGLEYFIGNVHWLDALTSPMEAHLKSLAGTVKVLLTRMQPPAVESPQEVKEPAGFEVSAAIPVEVPPEPRGRGAKAKARQPVLRRKWLIAALGAVALIGAGFAVYAGMETKFAGKRTVGGRSGTPARLTAIFGTSDGQKLWAVGDGGTITRSQDGGATWTVSTIQPKDHLESIYGTSDGQKLWVVGKGSKEGVIIKSNDGGATWIQRTSGIPDTLLANFGTKDGSMVWAVSDLGNIVRSKDGGMTWTKHSSAASWLGSIIGTSDGRHLWAVGGNGENGTILESGDQGITWVGRYSAVKTKLSAIFASSDGSKLSAIGAGIIAASDDGGSTWTTHNTGYPKWPHAIFGTSDGARLWAVGDEGLIIASEDGGATWTDQTKSGIANPLCSIFGTSDGMHLWIVGDKGVILSSNNGGKTWSK